MYRVVDVPAEGGCGFHVIKLAVALDLSSPEEAPGARELADAAGDPAQKTPAKEAAVLVPYAGEWTWGALPETGDLFPDVDDAKGQVRAVTLEFQARKLRGVEHAFDDLAVKLFRTYKKAGAEYRCGMQVIFKAAGCETTGVFLCMAESALRRWKPLAVTAYEKDNVTTFLLLPLTTLPENECTENCVKATRKGIVTPSVLDVLWTPMTGALSQLFYAMYGPEHGGLDTIPRVAIYQTPVSAGTKRASLRSSQPKPPEHSDTAAEAESDSEIEPVELTYDEQDSQLKSLRKENESLQAKLSRRVTGECQRAACKRAREVTQCTRCPSKTELNAAKKLKLDHDKKVTAMATLEVTVKLQKEQLADMRAEARASSTTIAKLQGELQAATRPAPASASPQQQGALMTVAEVQSLSAMFTAANTASMSAATLLVTAAQKPSESLK